MNAVGQRTTVGRAVKGEHRSPVNAQLSRYGGWEQAGNRTGASPTDLRTKIGASCVMRMHRNQGCELRRCYRLIYILAVSKLKLPIGCC